MTIMTGLTGRTILITGASAGIGFACAETLAQMGAKVIACARNIDKLQKLKIELGPGIQLHAIKTDMSKANEVLALFEEIAAKYGGLDILINNAGMAGARSGPVVGDFQQWKGLLELNVLGLTLATREAVKLIESSESTCGHIINFSSTCGHYVPPQPVMQFYAATTHMVTALSEGLRMSRQSKNIRVTTEIIERTFGKEFGEHYYDKLPYQTLSPKDVAEAVVFVLSAPAHVDIDQLTMTPLGKHGMYN